MRYIFLLGLVSLTLSAYSQTTEKRDLTQQEQRWLLKSGILIDKYDWNDDNINCHLNLALDNKKSGMPMMAGGYAAAAIGSAFMAWGGAQVSAWGEKGGVLGLGCVMFAGGLTVGIIGGKRTQRASFNFNKASELLSRQ